jgi:uncharacterized phage-associated protein
LSQPALPPSCNAGQQRSGRDCRPRRQPTREIDVELKRLGESTILLAMGLASVDLMVARRYEHDMLARRQRAPLHDLMPHVPRIVAAIAVIIDEAKSRGLPVTQYDLVKALFLADRGHLNKFGRPITFDNYVAMKDGPVASLSYNFLKEDAASLRRHKIRLPWRRRAAPELGTRAFAFDVDIGDVDTTILSPSDLQELKSAITIVKSLGFRQVRKLTHEDQAYIEAWEDDGPSTRYKMSLSLLFDVPNEELATELAFLSRHV